MLRDFGALPHLGEKELLPQSIEDSIADSNHAIGPINYFQQSLNENVERYLFEMRFKFELCDRTDAFDMKNSMNVSSHYPLSTSLHRI